MAPRIPSENDRDTFISPVLQSYVPGEFHKEFLDTINKRFDESA